MISKFNGQNMVIVHSTIIHYICATLSWRSAISLSVHTCPFTDTLISIDPINTPSPVQTRLGRTLINFILTELARKSRRTRAVERPGDLITRGSILTRFILTFRDVLGTIFPPPSYNIKKRSMISHSDATGSPNYL